MMRTGNAARRFAARSALVDRAKQAQRRDGIINFSRLRKLIASEHLQGTGHSVHVLAKHTYLGQKVALAIDSTEDIVWFVHETRAKKQGIRRKGVRGQKNMYALMIEPHEGAWAIKHKVVGVMAAFGVKADDIREEGDFHELGGVRAEEIIARVYRFLRKTQPPEETKPVVLTALGQLRHLFLNYATRIYEPSFAESMAARAKRDESNQDMGFVELDPGLQTARGQYLRAGLVLELAEDLPKGVPVNIDSLRTIAHFESLCDQIDSMREQELKDLPLGAQLTNRLFVRERLKGLELPKKTKLETLVPLDPAKPLGNEALVRQMLGLE